MSSNERDLMLFFGKSFIYSTTSSPLPFTFTDADNLYLLLDYSNSTLIEYQMTTYGRMPGTKLNAYSSSKV